ncbi:hypothetical protein GCM10025854_17750 [Tetragenococcus muriaticus]|nr:hypothetical protein GCM10025854_17750 [Tetragenococcus muriaticus]
MRLFLPIETVSSNALFLLLTVFLYTKKDAQGTPFLLNIIFFTLVQTSLDHKIVFNTLKALIYNRSFNSSAKSS